MARQRSRILWSIALLMLCSKWGSPQPTIVKVVDPFGDEVGLMYHGSTVEFHCLCSDSLCRMPNNVVELTRDNRTINSTSDYTHDAPVIFRLKIDERFTMGTYRCQMGEVRWVPVTVNYYLCADDGPSCQGSKACCPQNPKDCPASLCIVRQTGPTSCSTLKETDCGFHQSPVCTTAPGGAGRDSVCHALTESNVLPQATIERIASCKANQQVSFADAAGNLIMHGSYMYYSDTKGMKLQCGVDMVLDSTVVVFEKRVGNKILWMNDTMKCSRMIPFNLYENLRPKGFEKTKLVATVTYQSTVKNASVYLVIMGDMKLELDLPKGPCRPNVTISNFNCTLKEPATLSGEFSTYLWVTFGGQQIGEVKDKWSIRNVTVSQKGVYTCNGRITHRTCNPFATKSVNSSIKIDLHESCIPKDLTTPESIVVKEVPPTLLYILFCASAVILVGAVIIAVILVKKIRTRYHREPTLKETLIESKPENKGHILHGESLQKLSNFLMNPANQFANAKKYVDDYLGAFDDEMNNATEKKLVVELENCRYGDIPCYRHSQIRGMHMSRINDWKMNPLYICMAPLPTEFARFWEAISAEKVGLIVWVGDLSEHGDVKIDPYIPLKQGSEEKYNDDNIPNLNVTVKTEDAKVVQESKYTAYCVAASITGSRYQSDSTSNKIVMHVREWPDHNIPKGKDAVRLHKFCEKISKFQEKQAKLGLPGVLFHCSAGVQRSVALLTLYIGRQIFVEEKKINLVGLMRYVKANRFGAFLLAPTGYTQVPIILGGLAALETTLKESLLDDFVPILITPEEEAVFKMLTKKTAFSRKVAGRPGASVKKNASQAVGSPDKTSASHPSLDGSSLTTGTEAHRKKAAVAAFKVKHRGGVNPGMAH